MRTSLFTFALLVSCGPDVGSDEKSHPHPDTGSGEVIGPDTDGDGITDADEGSSDPDGDGLPNKEDLDSDNDTLPDSLEAGDSDPATEPVDSDDDGRPDFLDIDSDNNCILDEIELDRDVDGDGIGDYADLDNDGDGINDIYELTPDCVERDSDGDGRPDIVDSDSDGDGISDEWESGTGGDPTDEPRDADGDGIYDFLDDDSDGDGIVDSVEGGVSDGSSEPRDTDGDGDPDFIDTDSDDDSLTDAEETTRYGTDPYDADTDGDGFSDGAETTVGTDPHDPSDSIDDLYFEVPPRTLVDDSFEFELHIEMGDIAFHLDTTCSMSSTASAMASEFSSIVTSLASTLPDAQYGVATYDDYAYGSYGSAGTDKPFELLHQISDNTSSVQSVLSSIRIHSGADGPESSMEAIYQGASGEGYDQGCNHVYDSSYDVKPFLASSSDPFGGGGGQFYNSSISGGGLSGGFGFRDYAIPILVYATDNYLRDPEAGYGAPGGCPQDAGATDVAAAVNALGGYLIGISVGGSTGVTQMQSLASATGSYADTDGDGAADDPLVFTWSGSSSSFRTQITGAVEDLVSSVQFERVSCYVEGDEWGFVQSISPDYIDVSGAVDGEVVEFDIEFLGTVAATSEPQLFTLTLNVLGDDSVLLDTMDLLVMVPASGS